MDHLPVPEDSRREIKVPYLGGHYDGGPFRSFLARKRTSLPELLDAARSSWSPKKVEHEPRLGCTIGDLLQWFDELKLDRPEDVARVSEVKEFLNSRTIIDTMRNQTVEAAETAKEKEDSRLSLRDVKQQQLNKSNKLAPNILENVDAFKILKVWRQMAKQALSIGDFHREREYRRKERQLVRLCKLVFMDQGSKYVATTDVENVLQSLRSCGIQESYNPLEHVEADSSGFVLAQLIQTWLFFGMLHETFENVGVAFDEADFIRCESSSRTWLTTQQLSKYISNWENEHELNRQKQSKNPTDNSEEQDLDSDAEMSVEASRKNSTQIIRNSSLCQQGRCRVRESDIPRETRRVIVDHGHYTVVRCPTEGGFPDIWIWVRLVIHEQLLKNKIP